ncbi:MAG: VWA domain-containing protein [Planctomycetes bacterium]|nr:VWA domain-containing protein [Planctomycetota bacterium]
MFQDFFTILKKYKVGVSLSEWMTFQEALDKHLVRESLMEFYYVARAVMVKSETRYDKFDSAFVEYFTGVEAPELVRDEFFAWLSDPKNQIAIENIDMSKVPHLKDLQQLLDEFRKRLEEQKERHDFGSKWVGTGGTSPFGNSGFNPAGIRVGGEGGGRSAVQVAANRAFRNYRSDLVLDVRQIKVALRDLRELARVGQNEELDLDGTIEKTCKNGGDIELEFHPGRKNTTRMLLLMDVGGSMTPHARLVSRLFSAAHQMNHFKDFRYFYFHNCVYDRVYKDIERRESIETAEVMHTYDENYKLVLVGDACMASYELVAAGGAIDYYEHNLRPGIEWLRTMQGKYSHSIWLNPDPRRYWDHPTVSMVGNIFPMFELTLDGLEDGIDQLKRRN